jgi:hypothetical protein
MFVLKFSNVREVYKIKIKHVPFSLIIHIQTKDFDMAFQIFPYV